MYEALALELEQDQEGAGADGDLAGLRGDVKLFDVESTVGQGGPTDESAR